MIAEGEVNQQSDRGKSIAARIWSAIMGAWGAFTGVLPHVLHHVGPLAGTALLAGSGGRALFAILGLVAAVPFLLRLRRRFGTWAAPAIGLAVFALMYSISTFFIGPLISGRTEEPISPLPVQSPEPDPHHTGN